jgi:hypothetical protein
VNSVRLVSLIILIVLFFIFLFVFLHNGRRVYLQCKTSNIKVRFTWRCVNILFLWINVLKFCLICSHKSTFFLGGGAYWGFNENAYLITRVSQILAAWRSLIAYDSVYRYILWKMVENIVPNSVLKKIKCICRNTKVNMRFDDGTVSEPIRTNIVIWQECDISPILFNVYVNKIIQEFRMVINKGVQLTGR